MILCITEKPSVGRDIAKILGADRPRDGFIEGSEGCPYVVTWTLGHLCCLKEPGDYTQLWQRWSLGALPMIPPRFGIKVIPEERIEKQFRIVESLIQKADQIVNCGDAGQEGELIQRWVMQKAGAKCPVSRLWISSLTDDAIRAGFAALRPQADFDNLFLAGLGRAVGDWILGMNATRLYTLKYSQPGRVLSVGRVQTPTLALIVERHKQITDFVAEDYWELRTRYRDVEFTSPGSRYGTEADAQAVVDSIAPLPLEITDVAEKKGREAPPRLFDLTSLQVECNKKWGWTADDTLRLIQSLYEKKVTTYPRVDTTYLTDDIYAKLPDTLRRMTPYAPQIAPLLELPRLPKSKKVFDNSKVTDHHAIIPTGESPAVLIGDERKLYHLIALRFIAVFYPDCTFTQTTVTARAGKTPFKATGKVITSPGWRALYDSAPTAGDDNAADDEGRILPPMTAGESGPHNPFFVKKTTQPPKPYTEATLLRAMEGAGKTVDDEELREALKENGIGRPSTRAAIIETLFRRRYLYRERKNILPTQAGIDLIDLITDPLLKSAKLTGIWENKLRRIERGSYQAETFIAELKQLISEIVITVLSDNSQRRIQVPDEPKSEAKKPAAKKKSASKSASKSSDEAAAPRAPRKKKAIDSLEQIPCPACGKGHLLRGRTAYGCSLYASGCALRLPFEQYPATLTPAELAARLKKKAN